jgi:oxygen-independent coproporphyrinogen-3 oxidase
MLTYEPGTPLDRLCQSGDVVPADEDRVAALFDSTVDRLSHAGYEHYEISNFSRSRELRSRHNQKYWDHTPYTGFGPAAHSFIGRERSWNTRGIRDYVRRIEVGVSVREDMEVLTNRQLMMETIYLGLRTSDGIDLERFGKRFGTSFQSLFASLLRQLMEERLLNVSDGRCALTPRGMRFHDFITSRFVDETV